MFGVVFLVAKTDKSKIAVHVYFNPKQFAEIAILAITLKFRHGGSLLYRKKPNGFADEQIPNTKGISKLLKHLAFDYYKDTENIRNARISEIQAKEKELRENKAKLGIL